MRTLIITGAVFALADILIVIVWNQVRHKTTLEKEIEHDKDVWGV